MVYKTTLWVVLVHYEHLVKWAVNAFGIASQELDLLALDGSGDLGLGGKFGGPKGWKDGGSGDGGRGRSWLRGLEQGSTN